MPLFNAKLRLTGPRQGQTVVLQGVQFTDGIATISGASPDDINGISRLLALYYGTERVDDGESDIHQDARQQGSAPIVQGNVLQDGPQANPEADKRTGAEQVAPGRAAQLADGVGHKNSLMDEKLRVAVSKLDPQNDEHWTASGLPKIDAVANILGAGSVLRSDIQRAANGVTRESVRG